jgi:hypothetical protein
MSQDDRTQPRPDPAADDDLSPVLPCLTSRQSSTRKTREARNGLANHPLTREYLDAGLRLMAGQFRPEIRPADDDDDEWSKQSAFFDWLSAQKVIDEVSRGGKLRGNQGTFEDRWPYKDYYIQDLLSYALWGKHWAQQAAVAEEFAEPLTTGEDFVRAVHEASYWSCRAQLSSASSRVWLIASAVCERYPAMKTAMGKIHRWLNGSWMPVYEAAITGRGLRLRPGITLSDVAEILSALSVGISLRIASDDDAGLIDDERRQSLLGTAALAVLASCIDAGDGRSLEEVVRELVGQDTARSPGGQARLATEPGPQPSGGSLSMMIAPPRPQLR